MKRFTDTAKWTDPWFRRLSAPAKMLWFYLLDHCDHIGIVEVDLELISLDCGIAITEKSLNELGNRIEEIREGKFIVPKFIGFQIGQPSDGCPAHKKTIKAINDHGLIQDSLGYHYPSSSLINEVGKGSNTLKEKEEDKEEDKKKTGQGGCKGGKARPESRADLDEYFRELDLLPRDADYAWDHWEGKGWKNGKDPIKDWKGTVRSWKAAGYWPSQKNPLQREFPWSEPKKETAPDWLPENWKEIAVKMLGSKAELYTSHTDIPPDWRFSFKQFCTGERQFDDEEDAA